MDQQQGQPSPVWGGGQDGGGIQGAEGRQPRHPGAPGQDAPSSGWGTTAGQHQVPGSGTGWGAPQPYPSNASSAGRPTKWTGRKGLLVGGVAVVVAAAAGAGAYAAGNNGAGAATGNAQGTGVPGQAGAGGQNGMAGPGGTSGMNGGMDGMDGGGMAGGPGGLGMGMGGLNAAIHSEYVVVQDSGYVTMAGQVGTVASVSADSLTVESEDGFTRTYAVGSGVQVSEGMRQRGGGTAGSTLSLSNVAAGATVRVTALKEGDTYTAQSIQLSATGTASSGTTTN
ncbi:hypothetical protein [Arthrobacter sp. C152]